MSFGSWSLEVVRGKTVGRSYPVIGPEMVLGSETSGENGIDLADQEGDSPRRMGSRQAHLSITDDVLLIRDLASPGGTFVNRQRLLPDQSRSLYPGDLIQLGSVQIRVSKTQALVTSPKAANTFSYSMPGGTLCRGWDDFLTLASQKWEILREELESGKIDKWLISIGRPELITNPNASMSPDERLHTWLGGLPTTRPAQAELELHPKRLVIKVIPGGGRTSRTVQVANVGHRLLRIQATITPRTTPWVKLGDTIADRTVTVQDFFDLPLEITIPDALPHPLSAILVVEGQGVSQNVQVVLEVKQSSSSKIADIDVPVSSGLGIAGWIRQASTVKRLFVLGFGGLIFRMLVTLSSLWLDGNGVGATDSQSAKFLSAVVVFATLGALIASFLALRNRAATSLGYSLISGVMTGSAVAAILIAMCRSIEPLLGGLASSTLSVAIVWSGIGVVFGLLSVVLIPSQSALGR